MRMISTGTFPPVSERARSISHLHERTSSARPPCRLIGRRAGRLLAQPARTVGHMVTQHAPRVAKASSRRTRDQGA